MTVHLTCIEEECVEILTENIRKKNFIRKITSQTEEHTKYTVEKWS